ncbi:MAG TPA: surface-adhesin E family protein [Burkholderiaceae bacterium]|nr:surface-adhesin E family protein [Burkholderiaceae bacterium]
MGFLLACSTAASAQTPWLTISGAPENPAVNTVQVDPVPVDRAEGLRTMRVRVSRSAQRTSWDGVSYRSYESSVLFDCRENTARYLFISFYTQPGWKGEPHQGVDYSKGPPRWMEFREVEPNPTARILHAACAAGNAPR